MAQAKYITINDLSETAQANLNENAELMINNSTEAVPATKVKVSTILAKTKADIANIDGDIVALEGDVEDLQTGKANIDLSNIPSNYDYIVEQGILSDGTIWRKYKSNILEQMGTTTTVSGGQNTTVTFPKPFSNAQYIVIAQQCGDYTAKAEANSPITEQTKTGFTIYSGSFAASTFNWRAIGQGAN